VASKATSEQRVRAWFFLSKFSLIERSICTSVAKEEIIEVGGSSFAA
jgi:hypothetical protein